RGFAAAQFQDQPGRELQARLDKRGVDTALEAIARIADDFETATGCGGADRVEQRRLDIDLGRGLGTAGRLATDDTAEALYAVIVGDDADLGVERVFAAVQRLQFLAGLAEAHD